IAADINPGSAPTVTTGATVGAVVYNSARSSMVGANTRNHKGDGQNVLYGDGHVDWQATPFAGPYRSPSAALSYRDLIYTAGGTTGTGGTFDTAAGNGVPYDQYDSVLLPTDNSTRRTP